MLVIDEVTLFVEKNLYFIHIKILLNVFKATLCVCVCECIASLAGVQSLYATFLHPQKPVDPKS